MREQTKKNFFSSMNYKLIANPFQQKFQPKNENQIGKNIVSKDLIFNLQSKHES